MRELHITERVCLDIEPAHWWFLGAVVYYGLALGNCYHVLGTRSSPAASISWIWANLAIPVLGVPLYWLFGPGRISGYSFGSITADAWASPPTPEEEDNSSEGDLKLYEKIFRHFGPVFHPLRSEVALLADGASAFDAIFKEISRAQQYILVQYYILKSDRLGQELKRLLMVKARQGLRIYLLYDHMGSFWLPKAYLNDLKKAGIRTATFLPIFSLRKFFLMNFRNHRKLVVVDGKIAFTGGLNAGEEYAGSRFGKKRNPWRDTLISVKGPSVRQIEAIFLGDWLYSNKEDLYNILRQCREHLPQEQKPCKKTKNPSQKVLLVPSGPYDQTNIGMLLFLQMIHGCKQRIWVSTPYFVPDESLQLGLELAVLRGVDVRILIPKTAEYKLVHWVTLSYAEQVQRSGVKILLYDKSFIHQKVFLIDDSTAFIGTCNFDNRALYLNFEMMVGVFDKRFNRQVESMLLRDFDDSHEFAPYSDRVIRRLIRLRANGARLLAPLL